jgi:hypothetical protein
MAASMPTMANDVVRVPSKYVAIVLCFFNNVLEFGAEVIRPIQMDDAAPDASFGATFHGNNRPHTFVHPKIPQHVVLLAEGR